jgi:hypothetical protein
MIATTHTPLAGPTQSTFECPLCHKYGSIQRHRGETAQTALDAHVAARHGALEVGDGVTQRYVNDSHAYVVVEVRGKRALLAPAEPTEEQHREWTENIDGNPWPTMRHAWTPEELDAAARRSDVRSHRWVSQRSDGCWRFVGADRHAGDELTTGRAVSCTDYRY